VRQDRPPRAARLDKMPLPKLGHRGEHLIGGFTDKAADDRHFGFITLELFAFEGVDERTCLRN
jgi:hypothetical protein